MTTELPTTCGAAVRSSELVSRLRELIKSMRDNATTLRAGEGYAHPELQSERNASAHSMEFWALRIEEELAANGTSAYDELRERIALMESLIAEAPKFFAVCDFNGEKLDWLKRAGLVSPNAKANTRPI